jgi:MFS family permease
MSALEWRVAAGLSGIYGLRMLGLFLILPVFAIYAEHLAGGHDHTLVGYALGAYGLTQALLQLPFGMASDRFGRKRVIYLGLVLFALGSFIAAVAEDIYLVIVGRAIQGAGAINAAVTALLADLTREEHRTKAMAMVGGSIGLTFALSLVLGPALYRLISIPGIFAMTGVLALLAMLVVRFGVPDPRVSRFHADTEAAPAQLARALADRELLRLYFGIFVLHAVQMAMFLVLPLELRATGGLDVNHHWQVYLPVLLISAAFMLPAILYGERSGRLKPVFLAAIGVTLAAELLFVPALGHFWELVAVLTLYFTGFNVLEATLPALVSRLAPAGAKGTAMGVYNTLQSLGLFAGGVLGGWVFKHLGAQAVFLAGGLLVALWLAWAARMRRPPAVRTRLYHVLVGDEAAARALERRLRAVRGVAEAVVVTEEGTAYLKVDPHTLDERTLEQVLAAA